MSDENKKKILVVDDDDNLRLPLTDKLKIEGFEVSEAKDGGEGLKKALEIQPDVILLDIMMPVMSGWEMFGKLRNDKRGKNIKVIMLTVIGDSGSVARVMQDGKSSYLMKTEQSIDSIVKKVKSVIEDNS
jgi:DNA-binding response OmpR family regulator